MSENQIVMKKKFKLLVTIVERGYGVDVVEHNRKFKASLGAIALGYDRTGDAPDIFLNEKDTEVVFSIVKEEVADAALKSLNEEFELDDRENGVAFTIPIMEIGGLKEFFAYAMKKYNTLKK